MWSIRRCTYCNGYFAVDSGIWRCKGGMWSLSSLQWLFKDGKVCKIAGTSKFARCPHFATEVHVQQLGKLLICSLRLIFLLTSNTQGTKPTKICTHEELATVITMGYSHPRKIYPLKNLTHEILWPREFVHLHVIGQWAKRPYMYFRVCKIVSKSNFAKCPHFLSKWISSC